MQVWEGRRGSHLSLRKKVAFKSEPQERVRHPAHDQCCARSCPEEQATLRGVVVHAASGAKLYRARCTQCTSAEHSLGSWQCRETVCRPRCPAKVQAIISGASSVQGRPGASRSGRANVRPKYSRGQRARQGSALHGTRQGEESSATRDPGRPAAHCRCPVCPATAVHAEAGAWALCGVFCAALTKPRPPACCHRPQRPSVLTDAPARDPPIPDCPAVVKVTGVPMPAICPYSTRSVIRE